MGERSPSQTGRTGVSDNDDHDRVMRIIPARCGDVLTDADLALFASMESEPDTLPVAIGEQIMEVLDHMMDRLDRMADVVGANNDEDDDAAARRGARQAGA
jgi:hypothetical protein